MLDDATVLARLDSELYGALTHASHLAAQAVAADMTAARVADGPPLQQRHFVCGARLGLSPHDEESLCGWVRDDASLFGFVQQRQIRGTVFRPRDLLDELDYARQPLFRRLDGVTEVRDAVCVTFDVSADSWCTLALLRCDDSAAFTSDALATLERLRPALSRVVKKGIERETTPRGVELRPTGDGMERRPVSAGELLAKLSRTELHVLNYLRSVSTEKEIADQLGRSPHTVHVHVKNIYRKLGVSSRKHLSKLFKD